MCGRSSVTFGVRQFACSLEAADYFRVPEGFVRLQAQLVFHMRADQDCRRSGNMAFSRPLIHNWQRELSWKVTINGILDPELEASTIYTKLDTQRAELDRTLVQIIEYTLSQIAVLSKS